MAPRWGGGARDLRRIGKQLRKRQDLTPRWWHANRHGLLKRRHRGRIHISDIAAVIGAYVAAWSLWWFCATSIDMEETILRMVELYGFHFS